tara:strand:- start:71 stop:1027 length:957 start_codon:yes stop_codon:yes gene_type:complete
MAYSAGDTILDDEYNNFVNKSSSPVGLNTMAGTGSGTLGLGQSAIATVSAGDTINASSWNALFTGITAVAGHTADTMTSRSAVSAGDAIAIKAAVANDLATLAASIAAGCPNTTRLTTSSALQSPASSSTWTGSFTTEVSATFANADKMRHFFNAGGKIRIDPIRVGNGGEGGASGSDSAWDNLNNAVGNFDIKQTACTRSGSGETQDTFASTTGFHDLGTGYTTLLQLSDDSYPYTSNNIKIEAKINAAVGSATVMTIKTTATDGKTEFTYNDNSADNQAYRNGQHQHRLFSINTTSATLTNAHAPSTTGTVSNSTA